MSLPRLDLTFADPALNLAVDEALFDAVESGRIDNVLRLWRFETPVVVLGRGSKWEVETHWNHCVRDQVPVLRRTSGGAAIIAGPGCQLYSLLISLRKHPELRAVDHLHQYVMHHLIRALANCQTQVAFDGICDLVIQQKKISGNSLRLGRHAVLYHGTILCNQPIGWATEYLGTPPRQPEYRHRRDHDQFMTNVGLDVNVVAEAIAEAFDAKAPFVLEDLTAQAESLARSRYRDLNWTVRH